jgi:dUTP pyrophosphatase
MIEEISILVRRLPAHGDLPLPKYMTECAAGMDVYAAVDGEVEIPPGQRRMIPTGLAIALPEGYEAQIRPRSGIAIQSGVTLVNSPGTIDADYRGEIRILMINHGEKTYRVVRGDRIAQMVIQRVCRVTWAESGQLDATGRGTGGFGHTR